MLGCVCAHAKKVPASNSSRPKATEVKINFIVQHESFPKINTNFCFLWPTHKCTACFVSILNFLRFSICILWFCIYLLPCVIIQNIPRPTWTISSGDVYPRESIEGKMRTRRRYWIFGVCVKTGRCVALEIAHRNRLGCRLSLRWRVYCWCDQIAGGVVRWHVQNGLHLVLGNLLHTNGGCATPFPSPNIYSSRLFWFLNMPFIFDTQLWIQQLRVCPESLNRKKINSAKYETNETWYILVSYFM